MQTKKHLFVFNPVYFIWAVILLVIEVIIALYINDNFIRPYIGDVLVVILLYCLIKGFINSPIVHTAIAVLLFSFVVETLQYFNFVKLVGLEKSALANIVMGNYFAWADMLAYTSGIVIVLILEKLFQRKVVI